MVGEYVPMSARWSCRHTKQWRLVKDPERVGVVGSCRRPASSWVTLSAIVGVAKHVHELSHDSDVATRDTKCS
jgi:hypothetical protein